MAMPPIPPSSALPPAASEQPLIALTLKTFDLGGKTATPQATNTPSLNTGVSADAFQKSTPSTGNPQQDLQAAYNVAERARNDYLSLASRINSEAYQSQFSAGATPGATLSAPLQGGSGVIPGFPGIDAAQQPQLPAATPAPAPAVDPQQQMVEEQQRQAQAQVAQQQLADDQLQAQQQLQQLQQLQAAQQQPPAVDPAQQQQPQPPAIEQPPVDPQQQAQQQQPPVAAEQQALPQQPSPPNLSEATPEELNRMISQAQSLQEKVDAMAQLSVFGKGNPETYQLLKQEASSDTSQIPPGEAQQKANYVRQTALWSLGILNAVQNAQAPTAQLPGMNIISNILANPAEDPSVKVAAIQSLQVINRPQDPAVQAILKKAKSDANPDVKSKAQSALAGESIPVPVPQQQTAPMGQLMPAPAQPVPIEGIPGAQQPVPGNFQLTA